MNEVKLNVSDSELVNVAVPKPYLGDVYRLIGELLARDSEGEKPSVPWPTDDEEAELSIIDWTDVNNCKRLRDHLRNDAALTMLDLTAAKAELANPKVYLDEVITALSCTHGQASAGLAALTRGIRKIFGFKGNWPAPFQWDREQSLAFYVMDPAVAIAWKASLE